MTDYQQHPLAKDYPPTDPATGAMIEEDMRRFGFDPHFPIVLHQGHVLDGWTRYQRARAAGVNPVFVYLPEGQDPALFVRRANEQRRQLTAEWQQARRQERIQRVAAAKHGGASVRAIAEQERISVVQVQRDLENVAPVPGGTPAKVQGRDGKQYPSKAAGRIIMQHLTLKEIERDERQVRRGGEQLDAKEQAQAKAAAPMQAVKYARKLLARVELADAPNSVVGAVRRALKLVREWVG